MIRAILALAAAAAAVPAPAASPEAPLYSVRFRLHGVETRGGGEPSLLARAGEPATMMIGNDSYTLRIVATPDSERRVAVDAEVSYWTPAGLRYNQAEVELEANGETGSFAFPRTSPASGETAEVRVEFSAVPVEN